MMRLKFIGMVCVLVLAGLAYAHIDLSQEQAGTAIVFDVQSLEDPVGCVYIGNQYLARLGPEHITDGKVIVETTQLLEKLKGADRFKITVFFEGYSNDEKVRVYKAGMFAYRDYNEPKFYYLGETEVDIDLQIFVFRRFVELREIRARIIEEGAEWIADITPVFMMTDEARENLCGLVIPDEEMIEQGSVVPVEKLSFQPDSLDWCNKDGYNWNTYVKNQGSCGSCWAFAAIGQVEALVNVAENDPTIDLNLAEQTVVTDCCSWCGNCNGGWHNYALSYIRDTGVPLESCDPYTGTNGPCDRCPEWLSQARKITMMSTVTTQSQNETAIKNALWNHPLSTSVYVDYGWYSYSGGIYSYTGSAHDPNHAIVFVGWHDPQNYWKIKNSWGSGWGEGGYMRIRKNQNNRLGWYTYDATYTPLYVDAGDDTTITLGDTITLSPTVQGGAPNYSQTPPNDYLYAWTPSTGLSDTTVKNPQCFPTVTTVYTLTVTDLNVSRSDTVVINVVSGVQEGINPIAITVHQNYPNPFNKETVIEYYLPIQSNVSLKVYSATGRCIKTLVNSSIEKGMHTAYWNGTDAKGKKVATGIYFYRFETEEFSTVKKLILLR
jgi:hypothetical protein